jgi:transcriptional regulator with XRE-family HTH domain
MENTLHVRRAERRVNQTLVAKALGMGRDRYFRIERGYTEPTADEQVAIVRYFGEPHSVLFPGSPEPITASEGAGA